jgi:Tfp pilus assembly PilM family ATPase
MTLSAKGKMLAVEISPRLIRVAEFVPDTSPVQVTHLAAMERPGGEPAVVGQFIKGFLSDRGITAKRALVAYSGPLIEHRIYAVPPVARESREELLRGKVAQEVTTPIAELRVSGEVIGKVTEGGMERHEVLTIFTPEFEIRRLTFLLIEAGISPARVTSVPLALVALHPEDQKDVLAGFLHSEPGRCVIGISDGGKLRLSREFNVEVSGRIASAGEVPDYKNIDLGGGAVPPAGEPDRSEEQALAERLVTELTRSLLYFRQLSRGGAITRLYWSGDTPSPEVARLIGERLKLEISPHPAAAVSVFAPGLAGDAAEFAVPIGLIAAGQVPDQINLLPEGYLRRKKRRVNLLAVAVVAAVFLAANVGLYAGLHKAAGRYQEVVTGSAAQRSAVMQEGFVRWNALRRGVGEASAGERMLKTPFTRWKALFESLGAPVPREVAFSTLTVDRSGPGYRGEIRGRARGKNPAEAQGKINGFLSAVRGHGVAVEAQYAPVEVRPLREGEGTGYEQEFLLTFRIPRDGEGDGK